MNIKAFVKALGGVNMAYNAKDLDAKLDNAFSELEKEGFFEELRARYSSQYESGLPPI